MGPLIQAAQGRVQPLRTQGLGIGTEWQSITEVYPESKTAWLRRSGIQLPLLKQMNNLLRP